MSYIPVFKSDDLYPDLSNEEILKKFVLLECDFSQVLVRFNPMIIRKSANHIQGYDRDDVYQELVISLFNAANKWDPERDILASTYIYPALCNTLRWLARKANTDRRSANKYTSSVDAMVTTGEQESTELAEETDLSEIDMLSGVKLTDMERRVISLILGGCSNSDMCHITGLSSARLKTILRGLSRKLER